MALLFWNFNGYRSHFGDLQLLLVDHQPLFSCLQKMPLLPEHHLHLRGYACYRKDTDDGLCAHGGVVILVHDSVHSQDIALQSILPVVATKVTKTHLSFIVCSLYLPSVCPYLQLTSLACFLNSQSPSLSLVTSMSTIPSETLVGHLRVVHFLSNYFLLIISFF